MSEIGAQERGLPVHPAAPLHRWMWIEETCNLLQKLQSSWSIDESPLSCGRADYEEWSSRALAEAAEK
eukprot:4802309-Karenia_brevis.AAC.1